MPFVIDSFFFFCKFKYVLEFNSFWSPVIYCVCFCPKQCSSLLLVAQHHLQVVVSVTLYVQISETYFFSILGCEKNRGFKVWLTNADVPTLTLKLSILVVCRCVLSVKNKFPSLSCKPCLLKLGRENIWLWWNVKTCVVAIM